MFDLSDLLQQISGARSALETGDESLIGNLDLSYDLIQRDSIQGPLLINVSRNEYSEVFSTLATSSHDLFQIRGDTASGKSGFALDEIIQSSDHTCYHVSPVMANVGNVNNEFEKSIPNVRMRNDPFYEKITTTVVDNFDVEDELYFTTKLVITDAPSMANFIRRNRRFPIAPYIFIDESHQLSQDMIDLVLFANAYSHPMKIVLISATPDGFDHLTPAVPKNAVIVNMNVMSDRPPLTVDKGLKRTPYNPEWLTQGLVTKTVAYMCPTPSYASRLKTLFMSADYETYSVDKSTTAQEFELLVLALNKRSQRVRVVIIQPEAETGITLPIAVMVDTMTTCTPVCQKGILYITPRAQTPAESAQRSARCARNFRAKLIRPSTISPVDIPDVRDFYIANSMVAFVADGYDLNNAPAYIKKATSTFVKLLSLTKAQARAALMDDEFIPFFAMYRYDINGVKYSQCGGTSRSFVRDNAQSMRVYTYRRGRKFLLLPLFDGITNNFDPSKFVLQSHIRDIMSEIAAVKGLQCDLSSLIPVFSRHVKTVFLDFLEAVSDRAEFDATSFSRFYDNELERDNFVPSWSDVTSDNQLAKLFEIVSTCDGVGHTFDLSKSSATITAADGSVSTEYHVTMAPKFMYKNRVFEIGLCSQKMSGRYYNMDLNKTKFAVILMNICSVTWMLDNAHDNVNLESFRESISPDHSWFNTNVLT